MYRNNEWDELQCCDSTLYDIQCELRDFVITSTHRVGLHGEHTKGGTSGIKRVGVYRECMVAEYHKSRSHTAGIVTNIITKPLRSVAPQVMTSRVLQATEKWFGS